MWLLWPLIFVSAYFLAPILLLALWFWRIWKLTSFPLIILAFLVLILGLILSFYSQIVPTQNPYFLGTLIFASFLPFFLPEAEKAPLQILATHRTLLLTLLILQIWDSLFNRRPIFDSSPSYYYLPCICLCLVLSLPLMRWQNPILRLGIIGFALAIGVIIGQFFYGL